MAGGNWTDQNKVRPGVYIRFKTATASGIQAGERGVIAICKPLSWGAVGQVMEISPSSEMMSITGYDITAPENRFLMEMFKGSNRTAAPVKVLLYRPSASGSAQATAAIGNLTATAAYPGVRGNDITIAVSLNVDSEDYTVSTIVAGDVVDTQVGSEVADLTANGWVTWSGEGALSENTGVALAGGSDGTVAASAYSTFLSTIEAYKFDILCYDGDDSTVMAAYSAFIKRIAAENGQYAQLVMANATAPDSRFIINVVSGVILDDGTALAPANTVWWVAGVQAGARYNESLTYAAYPGAVAVSPVKTNSEIIAAISDGDFVLNSDDGTVRVETDINSLVSYTSDIGRVFRKNRVMRLCNQIANDIYAQFSANFIGVVNNNEIGRSRFKSVIVGYLLGIQANQGIQNFEADDVEVLPGNDIDAVVINLAIQPVDAVEKIYLTIEVA